MAIIESNVAGTNQWEVKATGEDIPKIKGMLTKTGNEAYRKAFHKNEGNWELISDPQGNPTHIPKDRIEEYRAQGYGRAGVKISMTVPDLPWHKYHKPNPGKHRYKYDKATCQMIEV